MQGDVDRVLRRIGRERGFTRRELEVFVSMFRGLTYPQIADALDCSTETIKTHAGVVLGKLAVSRRSDLARIVLEYALRELPSSSGSSSRDD